MLIPAVHDSTTGSFLSYSTCPSKWSTVWCQCHKTSFCHRHWPIIRCGVCPSQTFSGATTLSITTFSIATLSIKTLKTECHYAECHLCWVSVHWCYGEISWSVCPCDTSPFTQGILKGDVLLYHWSPVWLIWNQLYDNWQFLFLFAKQTNPNQSIKRSMVRWYFPL
jgi:hypothetical protein